MEMDVGSLVDLSEGIKSSDLARYFNYCLNGCIDFGSLTEEQLMELSELPRLPRMIGSLGVFREILQKCRESVGTITPDHILDSLEIIDEHFPNDRPRTSFAKEPIGDAAGKAPSMAEERIQRIRQLIKLYPRRVFICLSSAVFTGNYTLTRKFTDLLNELVAFDGVPSTAEPCYTTQVLWPIFSWKPNNRVRSLVEFDEDILNRIVVGIGKHLAEYRILIHPL